MGRDGGTAVRRGGGVTPGTRSRGAGRRQPGRAVYRPLPPPGRARPLGPKGERVFGGAPQAEPDPSSRPGRAGKSASTPSPAPAPHQPPQPPPPPQPPTPPAPPPGRPRARRPPARCCRVAPPRPRRAPPRVRGMCCRPQRPPAPASGGPAGPRAPVCDADVHQVRPPPGPPPAPPAPPCWGAALSRAGRHSKRPRRRGPGRHASGACTQAHVLRPKRCQSNASLAAARGCEARPKLGSVPDRGGG